MARVYLGTLGAGVLQDSSGNVLSGQSATVKVKATGANATHYSAYTGGSSSTSAITTSASGVLERWVKPGSYTVTVGANTYDFEAASGTSVIEEAAPYKVLDTGLFSGANIDAAVTQAKTEMGSTPGRIILPRGALEFSTGFPALNETNGIVLEGAGGQNAGATPGTRLTYKGTAARAIDARSSHGFGLRDLQLLADQAGFTGKLVDLSHSIASDASMGGIDGCFIGGVGSANGFTPVSLANAILYSVRHSTFNNCKGVRGRDISGDYSNKITFEDVTFVALIEAALVAAGQGWSAKSCGFQQMANGLAAAYSAGGMSASAVSFTDGCWFGDATTKSVTGTAATDIFTSTAHGLHAGDVVSFYSLTGGAGIQTDTPYYVIASNLTTNGFQVSATYGGSAINFTSDLSAGTFGGVWIDFSGSGLGVRDNYIALGALGVALGPSSFGADIGGNQFAGTRTALHIGSSCTDVDLHPNDFTSVTNKYVLASGASRPTASRLPGPTNKVVATDAPSARVTHNADQAIGGAGSNVTLAFNTERFDNDTIHDTASNNSRLTCRTPGKYLIGFNGRWQNGSAGTYRYVDIFLNGATRIAVDMRPPSTVTFPVGHSLSTLYDLSAGEYVEVRCSQDSGGSLNMTTGSNDSPEFWMVQVA